MKRHFSQIYGSMASKDAQTKPVQESKKKRRAIDLETKLKIIQQYENGKNVNAIGRDLGFYHSTITTIIQNKEKIKEAIKGSAYHDYDMQFGSSSGWFKRFKQRHRIKITGEAASADARAAAAFVDELDKIIAEGGYTPEQIFNMDETAIYLKQVPARYFIHQHVKFASGFKERATVLLGGNVAGFKLKPLVIWHSENPKAFWRINKHTLPVYYRSNRKSWMTQMIFEDVLLTCYVNEIKAYLASRNQEFKVLLILDNAPEHPPHIGDLHPNIKAVFLPPNTTSMVQPMDQGATAIFKAYYLKRCFTQAVAALDDTQKTFLEFWEEYNIYDAIKNISSAWNDVTTQCMNNIWKKTLKRFVKDFRGFEKDEEVSRLNRAIFDLANNNLDVNVEEEDIIELLELVPKELTNDELLEIEEQHAAEEEPRTQEEQVEQVKVLTVKSLAEMLSTANSLLKKIEDMDPSAERYLLVERQINDALACYKQIYDEKKRQTKQATLDIFHKKVTAASEELRPRTSAESDPQPGPSAESDDDVKVFFVRESPTQEESDSEDLPNNDD